MRAPAAPNYCFHRAAGLYSAAARSTSDYAIRVRFEAEGDAAMMRWFHALMPKEERFFDLFARHAEAVLAGARALRAMMEGGARSNATAASSWSASTRPTTPPARC